MHVRLYTCCAEPCIRLELLLESQCNRPPRVPDKLSPVQYRVTVNFSHKWCRSTLPINYYTQNKVSSHDDSLLATFFVCVEMKVSAGKKNKTGRQNSKQPEFTLTLITVTASHTTLLVLNIKSSQSYYLVTVQIIQIFIQTRHLFH